MVWLCLLPPYRRRSALCRYGMSCHLQASFMLSTSWDTLRAEYSTFVDRWSLLMNEVHDCPPSACLSLWHLYNLMLLGCVPTGAL